MVYLHSVKGILNTSFQKRLWKHSDLSGPIQVVSGELVLEFVDAGSRTCTPEHCGRLDLGNQEEQI